MLQILLDTLRTSPQKAHAPVVPLLDCSTVAISGHSRGGAIAALHAARSPHTFFATILVDPVDFDGAPASQELWSSYHIVAADHVPQASAPILTIGAGITGTCNPEGRNYKQFFGALGAASRQVVVT